MSRLLPIAAAAALLALACTDALPCAGSSCPPIEGAYLVSWQTSTTADCTMMGPRPSNLNVSREGSRVSALIGGLQLTGNLYDTYDFSLSGGPYSMRGRAVVGSASSDGGVRLTGTLITDATDGGASCRVQEGFTADKL